MIVFSCDGGSIVLPADGVALVDRADGGNLIINPPRPVWERSELTPDELTLWSFLVAATGQAMLAVLPQLAGGCINYWEAGNWALNAGAPPTGAKRAPDHRQVHLHLLGRAIAAVSPAWQWGEAPAFPKYAEREVWARANRRLSPAEAWAVVKRTAAVLEGRYGFMPDMMQVSSRCESCGHPFVALGGADARWCDECAELA